MTTHVLSWTGQSTTLYFDFLIFFSIRLLSVLRGHLVFSSPPQRPMTSDFEGFFYTRSYPLHLFSYLNSWERASIFPFECWVLNKGTTGTIFITSLVWRGRWLGIEAVPSIVKLSACWLTIWCLIFSTKTGVLSMLWWFKLFYLKVKRCMSVEIIIISIFEWFTQK